MNLSELLQIAVVALIVLFSLWRVIGRYAPRLRARISALLLGRKIEPAATAGKGCDDGCGSCSGCGTPAAKSNEKPLSFQPRR